MKLVREHINEFKQGQDPYDTMGLSKYGTYTSDKYEPHYVIRDLVKIKSELKSHGFNSYTPAEKGYKYSEKYAVILTTNPAGDLYGKEVMNLISPAGTGQFGDNMIKYNYAWEYPPQSTQSQDDHNENIFLVIPHDYNQDNYNTIANITNRKKYIDFDRDKRIFSVRESLYEFKQGQDPYKTMEIGKHREPLPGNQYKLLYKIGWTGFNQSKKWNKLNPDQNQGSIYKKGLIIEIIHKIDQNGPPQFLFTWNLIDDQYKPTDIISLTDLRQHFDPI
jgi:hypothetical protein